jgi:hypothetical protein
LLLAIALWLTSCYSATEIQLVLETDIPCATVQANGVAVFVAGSSETLRASGPVATTSECTPGTNGASIGTLTLVPSGGPTDRVFVDVVIGYDKRTDECGPDTLGCSVARRAPRYIRHASLRLPMRLYQKCANVRCGTDETCEDGACVAFDRCGVDGCGGGVGGDDASASDASSDATSCDGGVCPPQVVVSGLPMPTELAVSGDDLFVTTDTADGGVLQCKTAGCAAPTVVVSGLSRNGAVAADATRLYYSSGNVFLRACDRPACTNDQRLHNETFSSLGLDTTSVYGVSMFNAFAASIRKADGGTTPLTYSNPLAMAFDASDVFFYIDTGTKGGMIKCPLTGCVPLSPQPALESARTDVRSMALDATHVYWAETDTGRVMRASRDLASPAVALSTTARRPRSVVVAGGFVYWTEEGVDANDGIVVSTRTNGAERQVIASGQEHPYRLVSAGARLIWTNRVANGSVMSAPMR